MTATSRNTVKKYIERFRELRLTLTDINSMDDYGLSQLFTPQEQAPPADERYLDLQSLLPHYYSVPYRFIGKKVKLLYNSIQVELFYKYERIALHQRSYRKYTYTTNSEHLASAHRFLSDWTPEKFIEEAAAVHEDVAAYIIQVIEHKAHPEQAYKSCSGILQLKRKAGTERLINACRRANSYGVYNYPIIVQILDWIRTWTG
ncbi:MAG: hypothetical protein PW786_02240 [Arachidicoccus sp.]|nr:hypothetical protein [Arachidicoccus sp.]